jgi:hypothetical protein
MKTRDVVIVMAAFYAITIPISVIFLIPIEEEEKKHGLEIMMDKTVYRKGEVVEYDGHDFIIQNNTGWDRGIFSDYKKLKVIDDYGFFLIQYMSDYVIKNTILDKSDQELFNVQIIFNLQGGGNYTLAIPNSNFNNDTPFYSPFTYDIGLISLKSNTENVGTHTQYFLDSESEEQFVFTGTSNSQFKPKSTFSLYDYIFPPLKQTQNGVEPQNILCKGNLELILHPSSSPACIKLESIPKLIERGWKKLN